MVGFDPLTLSAAYILASMSAAECPAQGPVDVDVHLTVKESPYVTNMTAVQIDNAFRGDMNTTMSTDKWIIEGLMKPSMESGVSGTYNKVTKTMTGETCFAINKINYEIVYSPTIYVASDFQGMACRHAIVLNHEKHHVEEDVRTITDYIPDMKRAIESYAETLKPLGPFPPGADAAQVQAVFKQVHEATMPQWQQLTDLRRKRQGLIDTEANYRRETAMCPGQFPKFDGSK